MLEGLIIVKDNLLLISLQFIDITSTDLKSFIRHWMKEFQSQSADTFRSTLLNKLSSAYPNHYFTCAIYGPTTGFDSHAVRGYSFVDIFREYGRNVVVTYTKKSSSVPSSAKRAEIKTAVLNAIVKKVSRKSYIINFEQM